MKKLITFLVVVMSISCATDNSQPNLDIEPPIIVELPATDEPYELQLKIDSQDNSEGENSDYSLIVSMALYNQSHFVSPLSSDRFSGRFSVSIEDNEYLILDSTFVETPRSAEEFDPHPFVDGPVNWVRVNTTYQHQLTILMHNDFEVVGVVSFTIEPRCTFEEVEFIITYRSGEMEIKKINDPKKGC